MKIDFMTPTGRIMGGMFLGIMVVVAMANGAILYVNLYNVVPKLDQSIEEARLNRGVLEGNRRLYEQINDRLEVQKDEVEYQAKVMRRLSGVLDELAHRADEAKERKDKADREAKEKKKDQ